ncbi:MULTISPECIES: alpha/beta hydrolase [Subtercola]|uniref:Esterase n=1 Tax=Subtercola vilae TaxID=2056433 RepID=A0A4T2C925_9MICO|nr:MULTISPECIES: alpha/beta hydrolase-fold protein [Subtercola]MEA9984973.1 alpha/beta hydrolase-fold protein [Subtercola sp. RTI3]TIH39921.1 hypothetical protein D4765_03950 [Subtercola vilae]
MGSLGSANIITGPLVIIVYAVALVLALFFLAQKPGPRWRRRTYTIVAVVVVLGGAGLGWLMTWVFDVWLDVFGVGLSANTIAWVAAGFAGLALAVVSFFRSRWWRRIAGVVGIVVFAATTALSVNIDIGEYPTLGSVFGQSPVDPHPLPSLSPTVALSSPLIESWVPPANMPLAGEVSTVSIPGRVSHFAARDAVIYLPPAALTAHPPVLPVVVTLSGQPGSPSDPLVSGHLTETLNAYAAVHHGLAPIVVSPDQLSQSDYNPMCVDGPLGNSSTYLTVDVVAWVTAHLPVSTDPAQWGIAGFSQGGTCAIQLGAAHPELFRSILDVSGELKPAIGDDATTIATGFGGDAKAYSNALPLTILKKHTPYASTFAVFAAGENDAIFKPFAEQMTAAAREAGMTALYLEAPGSAHDYTTASYAFAHGFDLLSARWGLGS